MGSPAPGVCSPGWWPNPVSTDSEGTHGDVEGKDGPPRTGKEKEARSGKEATFRPTAWESHSRQHFLPTHDLAGIPNFRTKVLGLGSQPAILH